MKHKVNKNIYRENKSIPLIFLIITIILIVLSLLIGVYDIKNGVWGKEIFFQIRLPRTIALVLSAISMSVSGKTMQIITKNKMAEPTTTGTIQWASLGLLFAYIVFTNPTIFQITTSAIVFCFFGTILFLLFIHNIKLKSSIIVPIIGIMFSFVISAITDFLALTFNANQIIENWFIGSFASIEAGRYEYLWLVLFTTILIYINANKLTIISMGKDISTNLGINYMKTVIISTFLISLSCGVVAVVVGQIPFLGLIVPNIVSIYTGDDLRATLPMICLVSSIIMLICDILSRIIIMPYEIPVSLILGSVGSVVFLVIIFNLRGKNE